MCRPPCPPRRGPGRRRSIPGRAGCLCRPPCSARPPRPPPSTLIRDRRSSPARSSCSLSASLDKRRSPNSVDRPDYWQVRSIEAQLEELRKLAPKESLNVIEELVESQTAKHSGRPIFLDYRTEGWIGSSGLKRFLAFQHLALK